jgi:hypothetical protein
VFIELNVILDNSTRWNSTYDSIRRAIQLYTAISMFQIENEQELGDDNLTREDWEELREIAAFLQPFKELTMLLQSHATRAQHGSVWETLPTLELLLSHVELCKERANKQEVSLAVSINNCWQVLRKYYAETDNIHEVYANATLLNPTLRLQYFRDHWDGELKAYISVMQGNCWNHWKEDYLPNRPVAAPIPRKQSILDSFLAHPQVSQPLDEFEVYCSQPPTAVEPSVSFNLIQWWWNNQSSFPTLFQDALDKLAIPAMSAECERVFSSVGKMITPERNRLGDDIIEACECLKAWWDKEIIA